MANGEQYKITADLWFNVPQKCIIQPTIYDSLLSNLVKVRVHFYLSPCFCLGGSRVSNLTEKETKIVKMSSFILEKYL